jgi:hypothetical protein
MMLETVDNTIRNIMAHGGIDVNSGYVRVQRLLFDAMRDIKINISPDIRSVIHTIGSDFSVSLPNDSVRIYKVGKLCSDGSISIFGEEKKYVEGFECDCPGCSGTSVSGQSVSEEVATDVPYCAANTFHNFWFNGYYGGLYGARNDRFDNGKWSENNGVITFSSGTEVYEGAKVVVEYETSFNKKALQMIEDEDADILRNKVLHEFFLTSKPSAASTYYQKFLVAISNRKRRKTTMNHDEWLAIFTNYINVPQ